MRRWCTDTLIKGKLRLRPFGCCGLDERGLSDGIWTCRYGRSFWWLTRWKGTQRQCRVTALMFSQLRASSLVKFEIKGPSIAAASLTPQMSYPGIGWSLVLKSKSWEEIQENFGERLSKEIRREGMFISWWYFTALSGSLLVMWTPSQNWYEQPSKNNRIWAGNQTWAWKPEE